MRSTRLNHKRTKSTSFEANQSIELSIIMITVIIRTLQLGAKQSAFVHHQMRSYLLCAFYKSETLGVRCPCSPSILLLWLFAVPNHFVQTTNLSFSLNFGSAPPPSLPFYRDKRNGECIIRLSRSFGIHACPGSINVISHNITQRVAIKLNNLNPNYRSTA